MDADTYRRREVRTGTDPEVNGRRLLDSAREMAASPLPYVGALTVVLANEVVEWVAETVALSTFAETVAVFAVTLGLLYGQLVALAYYRTVAVDDE